MKKGIIYGVFMAILLGIAPSVNQNVNHLYNEQINKLTNLSKTPNEERVTVEEGLGSLEQPTLTPSSSQKITEYIEGTRIEILSNEDFGPTNYNFSGLGTQNDPYMIDGIDISGSIGNALIYIKDTTVYFQISNCNLDGQASITGIHFVNVTHGLIANNSITKCHTGILFDNASNNNISLNKIFNTEIFGLSLISTNGGWCSNNTIIKNTVYNASAAINLGTTTINPSVSENLVKWNTFLMSRDENLGHAVDMGEANIFQFNHWDDLPYNDDNSDGIIDTPYMVQGRSGLFFDGEDDKASLGWSPPSDDFTVELWVNPANISSGQTFISKNEFYSGSLHLNQFVLGYFNDGLYVDIGGKQAINVLTGKTTGWQHLAVVCEQNTTINQTYVQLFKNGLLIGNGTVDDIVGNTADGFKWMIGADLRAIFVHPFWSLGEFFHGSMREVRILNQALTSTKIYKDYATQNDHYPSRINTVAWYHLDERNGTVALDNAIFRQNGTINGATWDPGLSCDGEDDEAILCYSPPSDDFTVEMWVNPANISSGQTFISKNKFYSLATPLNLHLNQFLFGYFNDGLYVDISGQQALKVLTGKTTDWQHLAVVCKQNTTINQTNVQLFRNGLLIGNQTVDAVVGNTSDGFKWMIGADWRVTLDPISYSLGWFFNGTIREVRILNQALTTEEIHGDYSASNLYYPSRADTVAWYHLDEQNGTDITDSSGNGLTGTTIESTWNYGKLNLDPFPRATPIWINNNENFTDFSSKGIGSEGNPYILENYQFFSSNTPFIQIYNTTAYFTIKNSFFNGLEGDYQGIVLNNATNGKIVSNIINNTEYGIFLTNFSENNTIELNYLFDNNIGGDSQAYDDGMNNIFSYNYWNDHTGPDGPPPDGIVDNPYDIDGGSNQDLYPRAVLGPIVIIVSPLAQTYNVPKITITLSGSAIQYWYYIEGIDTQNQTWTVDTDRTTSDGTYTLHIYGNDTFGYVRYREVSFTIDFFDIVSPIEQEYGSAPITISFSGYAVHYWYYIDGEDLENKTWTSNTDRTLIEGSYTLHAFGNDSEGTIIHHSVDFTVETTPPIINLLSPQNTTYYQNTILLSYTVTDYDTYTIYLDDRDIPVPSGQTIQFPGVEDEGSHNISIVAVDHVGNIAQTTIIFTINAPPTLIIDSPLPTTYDSESIIITLSGDALHYWYFIADVDSANQTWTTDVLRNLPEGTYILHAYGDDSSGVIAHQSVTFTIDVPPSTTSSSTSLTTTTSTQQTSTTTSKPGSFPGFIAILLSILPLIIFVRKQRNL